MRADVALAALGVLGAVLLASPDASAFCRTSTYGLAPDCQIAAGQCCTAGKPLYWKNACVGYSLNEHGTRQASLDVVRASLEHAFDLWTHVGCPAELGGGYPSVGVYELLTTKVHEVRYDIKGPNANVILFDDDAWPHDDADNTLSLTTMTFDGDTGEVFDADMEFNTAQQVFAFSDPVPPNGFDFQSVVTHEAGHFLGLAHSPDASATMFAHYSPGSTAMRNLAADDVFGLCSVYRPDYTRATGDGVVPRAACDPTPRHGFDDGASPGGSGDGNVRHGCSAAPVRGAPARGQGGAVATALASLAAIVLFRRSRRARRRRGPARS